MDTTNTIKAYNEGRQACKETIQAGRGHTTCIPNNPYIRDEAMFLAWRRGVRDEFLQWAAQVP